MNDLCVMCAIGVHQECLAPQVMVQAPDDATDDFMSTECCCGGVDFSAPFGETSKKSVGVMPKAPGEMDDPLSTGRKRAAMLAPIFDGMVCEWAYLKFAGGGVVPIVGCPGHLLTASTKDGDGGDLHHGPDKNTLNNTPGVNLHRICKSCHHKWHKVNDQFYSADRPSGEQQWLPLVSWLKHDPDTRATDQEIAEAAAERSAINKREIRQVDERDDLL